VRRAATAVVAALTVVGTVVGIVASSVTSAFADTTAYELYCPGTPVGNIALNNVVTSGTITPANPAIGSTFNLTNWQSQVTIVSNLVSASAALGNTAIAGSATASVDATGATPATLAAPKESFSEPIPSPVPSSGLALDLPTPAGTLGPFTATSSTITISEDKATSLTLVVSGNNLTLTCTAYPNNSDSSGIVSAAPTASPISPQIATTSAGAATAPSSPSSTTATTAAPSTSSSSGSLASTGVGPGLYVIAALGTLSLLLAGAVGASPRLRDLLASPTANGRRRRRPD